MKMNEKYIEALKTFSDFVTIKEWAEKFAQMFPDDFKKVQEKVKNKKSSRSAIGHVRRNISSYIRNTKSWQLIIEENNDHDNKLVRYLKEEDRDNKKIEKTARNEKWVNPQTLIDAINDVIIPFDFPAREDPKYTGNNHIKGLENINDFEFTSCMFFEMARRNKKVVEIINKLEYIYELQEKYPYLEDINDSLVRPINNQMGNLHIIDFQKEFPKPPIAFTIPQFPLKCKVKYYQHSLTPELTQDIESQWLPVAKLSLPEFENDLEFLVDVKYSDNYNENWVSEMIQDGWNNPLKITEELIKQYKFKDKKGKTTIDTNNLNFGKLNIIIECLQGRLKNEFFIYPDGYYYEDEDTCDEKIIDKYIIAQQIQQHNLNSSEVSTTIDSFRRFKTEGMKTIADLFFIYDFYKKCEEESDKRLYVLTDIKSLLTRYHGPKIKETGTIVSFDSLQGKTIKEIEKSIQNIIRLNKESNKKIIDDNKPKNLELGFHEVEATINNSIKLMSKFIDNKFYSYLLFR